MISASFPWSEWGHHQQSTHLLKVSGSVMLTQKARIEGYGVGVVIINWGVGFGGDDYNKLVRNYNIINLSINRIGNLIL